MNIRSPLSRGALVVGALALVLGVFNVWLMHKVADIADDQRTVAVPVVPAPVDMGGASRGIPKIDPTNDPLAPVRKKTVSPAEVRHLLSSPDKPEERTYTMPEQATDLPQ